MKRIVALILALSMVFALCGCGAQSTVQPQRDEKVTEPERGAETQMTEEVKATDDIIFSFGKLSVEEVSFCNQATLFINVITWTSGSSDKSTESTIPYTIKADEESILFVIKGTLSNKQDEDVTYESMTGSISFGDREELPLSVYPYKRTSDDSFKTLFAGTSDTVTACAKVPIEQYVLESNFTIKLGETERVLSTASIPTVDSTEDEAAPAEDKQVIFEDEYAEPIVLLDDEYITVSVLARYEDRSFVERSNPAFYTLGFKLFVENKTDDKYLSVGFKNVSIDGVMNDGYYGDTWVSPNSKSYPKLVFNRYVGADDRHPNVETLEDIVNVRGVLQVYYNTNGNKSGTGLEKVEFQFD